ncbi:hypothetical protein CHS0354_035232 [Potamilus streckersoni]|uniref:AAA+ ATPase domain-containing protein n=1 Tax=Potamilus streckersoni TaxID=2493646 RepID=A0AAE0S2D9_9BIVA|nr:hypothetical protein CHS0354_035232 [Potamilus streckersoni]
MHAERCRHCSAVCNLCEGTGKLHYQNEQALWFSRSCSCQETDRKIALLRLLKLPGKFFDADFDNFNRKLPNQTDVSKFESALDKGKQFTDTVAREYAEKKSGFGIKGLLFHGSPGSGKTRLMAVILKELILQSSLTVRFTEFSSLISEIKKGYDNGESQSNLIDPLIEADILGIDELAKGRRSDWYLGITDEIITGRYNAGKITLFTTNYNPGEAKPYARSEVKEDDIELYTLQERLNPRIFSRLMEMTEFVDMNFFDYRQLEHAHNLQSTRTPGVNVIRN